ncbi:BA75_05048T0 [Komagataella pastoris]|uniref:Genetic interactor of prohibitins 3, mitochondrial n=1 Tax=Komagataella pastoris TaxID=4922 RepID=A0A1B2JIK2_PICPA|nr:BA75_05048T0 [Komagataella pastoris]
MYAYAYSYCSVINLFREIVLQKLLCEPSCFTLPVMLARKVLSRQCLVVTRLCPGIIASSFRLYSSRGVTRPAWINSCKYSSRSMTSSALFESPNCPSCGVVLQTEHPDKDGYCLLPKGGKKAKNNQDALKEKLLLSVKKEELADRLGHEVDPDSLIIPKEMYQKPRSTKRLVCQRCFKSQNYSLLDDSIREENPGNKILDEIPSNANIVHVLSAVDFPLGLSKELVDRFKPNQITYVITKSDVFFPDKLGLQRTGAVYFEDSLAKLVGADPRKVVLVSGRKNWGLKHLLSTLPRGPNYFLGMTNTGKSTLIRSIIGKDYSKKQTENGPGVSHLPSFTRKPMKFKMDNNSLELVDLPGYTAPNGGVYKYLREENYRDILNLKQLKPLASLKAYTATLPSKPKLFNGARVICIGGLVYIRPPKNVVLKQFSLVNLPSFMYSSLEKATSVIRAPPEALVKCSVVKEDSPNELVRYVIPPFYGLIDLVIQGVGFVKLLPTGARNTRELIEIFAPKDIQLMVRDSILKYIYKTHAEHDSTNNLLLKKNIKARGQTVLRRLPEKPVFTKLYPVPANLPSQELLTMVTGKEDLAEEDKEYRYDIQYPNKYWDWDYAICK